jgi:hypothetical protein
VRNYPWYKGWDEDFAKKGLAIIGIHTPESQGERDIDSVKEKVKEAGFNFPVAIDNDNQNWKAWTNHIWPSTYLVDKKGYVRYWWYGELNWQGIEGEKYMRGRIGELLAE